MVFSPHNPDVVLSASDDHTARLWRATTGEETHTLKGHTDVVRAAAFSPHKPALAATAGDDGTVRLWDVVEGKALGGPLMDGRRRESIRAVAFDPLDADVLVSTGDSGQVLVWSLSKRDVTAQLPLVHGGLSVAMSHFDSGVVVAGSDSRRVPVWRVRLEGGRPAGGVGARAVRHVHGWASWAWGVLGFLGSTLRMVVLLVGVVAVLRGVQVWLGY